MNQVTIIVGKHRSRHSSMNDAIVSVQRRLITERVFLLLEAELLDFCKLIFYPERILL